MKKFFFNNDNEAFVEMAEGNMVAYRYLFDKHFSDLCNFLHIYLHSKELSEEIALDIFTYIWEKRESLHIKQTFKSFLFASAKYKAISQYRKESKTIFSTRVSDEINAPDYMSAQQFLENQELRRIIQDAIDNLPEKSRMVYQMAWEDELSYKEISEKLNISIKTVENHVGIALKKLRESLKPFYKQIFCAFVVQIIS